MRLVRCKGCHAEIRWIKNARGNSMPCNPELVSTQSLPPGSTVVTREGRVVNAVEVATEGFIPHWATCPKAGEFRKRKTK